MDTNEKLKARRKELGLTLEDVAKIVGVGKSTVRKWETGDIANMKRDKIALLSKALKVSPAFIMGWEETHNSVEIPDGFLAIPHMVKKPRLGVIACGEPIMAEENFDGYDDVPDYIRCDFTLKCKGDSMVGARINDGDIVYIRQQPDVENGQIAAVMEDGEKTLKRVYKYPNKVILQPENPKYPPIVYVGEELNAFRILGKAVGFTSMIK